MKHFNSLLILLILAVPLVSSGVNPGGTKASDSCALNWQAAEMPPPETGGTRLDDIAAIAADDIWAVGAANGRAYSQHWDGSVWTTVPVPDFGSGLTLFDSVVGFASNDVWADGFSFGGSVLFKWDGLAWNPAESPDVQELNIFSLEGRASDDLWLTGRSGENPYAAHWDGEQWTDMTPSSVAPTDFLLGVAPHADDEVYLFVHSSANESATQDPDSTEYSFLKWDGTSWTKHSGFSFGAEFQSRDESFEDFSIVDANDIWVVGSDPIDPYNVDPFYLYRIVMLHWDGNTWTEVDFPYDRTLTSWMRAVTAISANDVWVLGFQERVSYGHIVPLLSHWNGAQWETLSPNAFPDHTGLNALVLVDEEVWAAGSREKYGVVWHGSGCATLPNAPRLRTPLDNAEVKKIKPVLTWKQAPGTLYTEIRLRRDVNHGQIWFKAEARDGKYKFQQALERGRNYFWRVRDCNAAGCSAWSEWRTFTVRNKRR